MIETNRAPPNNHGFFRHSEQLTKGLRILVEIVAKLNPSRVEESPSTLRKQVAGDSKLSVRGVRQYLGQIWRLSSASHYISIRFIKFGVVGASGILVNLFAFLGFARLLGLRDWRISAAASVFANLTNYVLNNAWTFVDRGHRRWSHLRGYVTYLGCSAVGMSVSTLIFAGLTHVSEAYQRMQTGKESDFLALCFQFVAILAGTVFNYELHKRFTWRNLDATDGALEATSTECIERADDKVLFERMERLG